MVQVDEVDTKVRINLAERNDIASLANDDEDDASD